LTEITEIQQLRNDLTLLQRQFEGGNAERFEHYFVQLREEQVSFRSERIKYTKSFEKIQMLENRFNEIEKFMKHLLDFFNPNTKMQQKIRKLEEMINERDQEIAKTRDILKAALK
jgi:hypothetical protein